LEIVNIRLNEDAKKKIDSLVSKGVFASRSEALRRIVEEHLVEHPELFMDRELEELMLEDLPETELLELCSTLFSGRKTAAELIREGRGM